MHKFLLLPFLLLLFVSCHKNDDDNTQDENTNTEVQATYSLADTATMIAYVDLNATSAYLQSSIIKSSSNGYIQDVKVEPGKMVHAGATAFVLKTKEAKALGNIITKLDSSFHFSGIIPINIPFDGFLQELNHQVGDYVLEGEQLAVVADTKSFGFILNVPYELHQYIQTGKQVSVILPGEKLLEGSITSFLPTVDSASQTQGVLIKIKSADFIPQNLIAKVHIIKTIHPGVITVPIPAVLTNEAQTEFWVMKMIDSNTAVKVEIKKGIASGERVEISGGQILKDDKILTGGNYGLPDTAKVKIVMNPE